MLVVVYHRYVETFLQTLLNIEAFGRLYVFKVDASERRGNPFHGFAELLRVFLCHFDVKHIDATVNLEEQSFALHDRLSAKCSDVSEAENGCSVAYHGNEITFVRVFVGIVLILLNLKTRIGNTR